MVHLEEIQFGYGRQPLFQHLNLDLEPGNVYGLLGQNGAGKTTLLRLLSGLVTAQGGEATVLGYHPRRRDPRMLREICAIPEEFDVPALDAATFAEVHGAFYPRFSQPEFRRHLAELQVSPRDHLPRLSYGQRKKVLLAFALATDCQLLLLDEPTNGLDIPAKRQFRKLVAGAVSSERAFVVSTHQVRDMEYLIDPVVILDRGRVLLNRSLSEIGAAVRIETDVPTAPTDALYVEEGLSGHTAVLPNDDGRERRLDLEVLFNAAITPNSRLASYLMEVYP